MSRIAIAEAIAVEGVYDKTRLSSVVDAVIVSTNGFDIMKNKPKLNLLRQLAQVRGLIVFTDPDGAGLRIRNFLRSAIDNSRLKHAYIPEIVGKERRKTEPSKGGLLGVEGVGNNVLLDALKKSGCSWSLAQGATLNAPAPDGAVAHSTTVNNSVVNSTTVNGATFGGPAACSPVAGWTRPPINKALLYELGLSGGHNSSKMRKLLSGQIGIPANLGANSLIDALNCRMTAEELTEMIKHVKL